ncbi:ABC transporter substrate-binding protein [Cryptosporangium aurantiacum]|uniref:Iron complex transport system substrate-binding protein n=1 Tax=Cryptosporangium aurantiacum TaxID=134849 RepID=A0A1M7RKN5_9ACTN|nr:ABC transporter substrate-binding protein [Cryptosporangium aurantiacum]SHN46700.1 iron complex transport system substrate-binding protein [Cryptosporangium aurantiacum]
MKIRFITAAMVVLAATAACGGTTAVESAASTAGGTTSVVNCGQRLSVAAPPQRAITLEQNATEILLSLGLADRMVGTSYQTDPVQPALADDYRSVPVLAKLYPSRESVLQARPDFLYSTFTSAYAGDAAGPRAEHAKVGIPAYLSPFACEKPADGHASMSFEGLFAEIREVATLFGVADRGTSLVAAQQKRLDAAVQSAAVPQGTTALWYYSGTSTPYVAGQNGVPAAISTLLGLENVYADATQTWPAGSWETIATRDPDVIVLADLTRGGDGDSAESKIRYLRQNPATAKLTAVREGRFVTVSGSSMDPSIRSVEAVEQVGSGLRTVLR